MIQQLTDEMEQTNKNSNIWKMFDNQNKSIGRTGKRKPDDETKNEMQEQRKKKLKSTGELERYIKKTKSK